jgi:hypothetical protein
METTLEKNKSTQDIVDNEENIYPVPDPNKTILNVNKEHSGTHKKILKVKILEETIVNFMEKMLHMVNQNVQDEFKKFQDSSNKEHEKAQKQINDFIKCQSEMKGTIKK